MNRADGDPHHRPGEKRNRQNQACPAPPYPHREVALSSFGFDHRLVQTGVIGHKNSDHPVILPMDAVELDRWRKKHPNYSYWCGIELGGCGGELSDRRYTNKVCHFAHHPNAPTCYRTATGESSADHLFIKRGVLNLLGKQKVRGKVKTRNLGTGPGDAVDVHLPGARRRLRFQLGGLDYRSWKRAADELMTEDVDDLDWVFGPETPVTRELVGRHGFCLRVRCETVGGERRVHIGAEAHDRTISWTPLEECELTPDGLTTPHVETIRVSQHRPNLPSFPLQGGLAFAPVPEAGTPAGSPFAAEGRHLLVAEVKPVDSPIVRALISLPGDTDPPPADHVYRVPDSARMLVTHDGRRWAIEAGRYVRLNVHEAQRTGLWTPPPMKPVEAPAPTPVLVPRQPVEPPRQETPQPVTVAPVTASSPAAYTPPPRPRTKADLVADLRDALAASARSRSTTTWAALARKIRWDQALLTREDRITLLLAVDRPLSPYTPVLSALVRAQGSGHPLPYLQEILRQLGVPYAATSTMIGEWAEAETERAFAAYATPARAMPPRLELPKQFAPPPKRVAPPRANVRPVVQPATVRRVTNGFKRKQDPEVEALIGEIRALPRGLKGSIRKRANKAAVAAEAWLAGLSAHKEADQGKEKVRRDQISSLKEALSAAHTEIASIEILSRFEEQRKEVGRRSPEQASARPEVLKPVRHRKTPSTQIPAFSTPWDRVTRELIQVAARGTTISHLDLEGGPTRPEAALLRLLISVDDNAGADVPLLSALVTGSDGGPVACFRDVLSGVGLAVPESGDELRAIWVREQERAHAAYANPPRELPPRLVRPA
ncbi:hypothetical protein [Streptomyces sp. CAU 1734]|uniref:hypothetical protein n=1 Tax=Streptomyces sp. CAU 1734 TaxID=3140360 RepID=UPI0032603C15